MIIRTALGLIMTALLLGLLWLDNWLASVNSPWMGQWQATQGLTLVVLVLILAVVALREISRMCRQRGPGVLWISGLLGIVAIGITPVVFSGWTQAQTLLLTLGVMVLAVFIEQMIVARTNEALQRISVTFMAIMYLGVGTALILTIRVSFGVQMLLIYLAGVKGTDTGAYFTGKTFGKHKLIPWLSPGKTWEGLIGGLIVGAGLAVAAAAICGTGHKFLPLWKVAIMGATVGLAGQFGDLCESLLKRSVSVKDSGKILPEFGGVLDIIDSPLLAAPACLIMLTIVWP